MGGGWKAKKGILMEARSLPRTKTRRETIKAGMLETAYLDGGAQIGAWVRKG